MWDTKNIAAEIKKALYGLIDERDVRELKREITTESIAKVLEMLRQEQIIDKNDFLLNDTTFDQNMLRSKLARHKELQSLIDPLLVLIEQRITRERFVTSPRYLKSFILENLDRWIDNAKLALYLRDKDDYIVDIDRHNQETKDTVVTILDKDTGTDQVNSQWDAGLHQFLQLKHGCRLTPQSLKAVFISNVSYFKKYTYLNGLSGTLGSEVERQHLVEAHAVDFLTVPTFKQKQFSEDLPIVQSTSLEWSEAILNESMKKVNSGRSILIVCESVDAVEQLNKVFEKNNVKVKSYTRDYQELDVIHKEQKLAPGHILIATNLAGRGTDLKLDDKLIQAGGLHVIVTYLTANDRVEQQAMGRAARKGDPGSGQLIILSDEFLDSKVSSYRIFKLKSQRRVQEAEHVSEVRKHYENQIIYEEKCFLRFNKAWEENRKRLSEMSEASENPTTKDAEKIRKVPPKVQELLERGVLDKWAFWLDSNMGHGRKINKNQIYQKMDEFIKTITSFSTDQSSWVSWVDSLAQSVSIGKMLSKDPGTADKAIDIFDKVISNEPDFCESALYYKALALFQKDEKEKLVDTLMKARKIFETRRDYSQTVKALIANVKLKTANIDSQSEAFEDQQERVIKIQDTFIKSIDDIIGHYADEKLLEVTDASKFQIKHAMEKLRIKREFIGNAHLDETRFDNSFKNYCNGRGVNFEIFKKFTVDNRDKVSDIPSFITALKNSKVYMPSREEFWEILQKANILSDSKEFYHLYMSEIEVVDPSFKDKVLSQKKQAMRPFSKHLYLYPEFVSDESTKYLTFEASVFNKLVPKGTLPYLKRHNCYSINKCAKIDLQKLKDYKFEQFSSINLKDLVTNIINEQMASQMIKTLKDLELLENESTDTYRPTEKFFTFDFEMPEVNIPPLYMEMLQKRLENCFAYAKAAYHLLKTKNYGKNTAVPLNARTHEMLVGEMLSHGIITSPKLSVNLDKEQLADKLRNVFNGELNAKNLKELPSASKNTSRIIEELQTAKYLSSNGIDLYNVTKSIPDKTPFRFTEIKSVCLLINTIHKLHTGDFISQLTDVFIEKAGTLNVITENFELVTKSLSDFTALETKEEEQQFIINGQDEILIGQKKKKESSSFWTLFIVIIVSIIMIVVGVVLSYMGFAPLSVLFIRAGIMGLISGLSALTTEVSERNVRGLHHNSIAEKAIKFLSEIAKQIRKYLGWEEKHEATLKDESEKVTKVVSADLKKLNMSKRTSQFETIVYEQLNGLTGKIMQIIKDEISKAMGTSNIRDGIRNLYEKFDHNDVTNEIHKIDDFVLALGRFSRYMEPSMNTFKVEIIGNIEKMTQKLEINSLKNVSTLRKALQMYIEDGIKLFESKQSDIFNTLDKQVLSMYKEGLNKVEAKIVELRSQNRKNKVLLEGERKKIVQSKYDGISESLEKSSNHLLNKINADIQAEVRQVVLQKVNFLIGKQIRNMSGSITEQIDMSEQNLYEDETSNEVKLSLIENEYDTVFEMLRSRVLQQVIQKNECNDLQTKTEDQKSGLKTKTEILITKHTRFQFESLMERYKDIFDPNRQVFANQFYNNNLINDILNEASSNTNSKVRQSVMQDFDRLKYALVEDHMSEYSIILQKLHSIYRDNVASICFNDLYKFCVLSAIEHSNKKWININLSQDLTKSEMGMVNLGQEIVIASTHNVKQPFVWETFKVIDESVNAKIIKAEKKLDDLLPPSVKLQLLRHLEDEVDESIYSPNMKLFLNGINTIEINSDQMKSILADHPDFSLEDGPRIKLDAVQEIFKFKNYLLELQDIALYCECNRKEFEEFINQIRGPQIVEVESAAKIDEGADSDENEVSTDESEEADDFA